MKKILGLPIGFMIMGIFLISVGKVEAVPYPFLDDFESGLVIGLQEGNGV